MLIIIISIALIALKSAKQVQSDQTHSNAWSQQLSTDQNAIGEEYSRPARPRMKIVRSSDSEQKTDLNQIMISLKQQSSPVRWR